MDEQKIKQIIREELGNLIKSDRYTFEKTIQILDGRNIETSAVNGSKIGSSASQKIGFYGITPVVQQTPSASKQVTENSGTTLNNDSTSTGGVGSTAYRFAEIVSALKNLGLIAQ